MARRIIGLNESDHRRMSNAVKRVEAMKEQRNRRQRRFSQDNAVKFYNNTNETMPAYGVGAVTGVITISGEKYLQVEKPDSTLRKVYLVNGGSEVAKYTIGRGYTSGTVKVLYDTGTPAVDEGWGPKASQWTLSKNYPKVGTVAGIHDTTEKIMLATISEISKLLGKADADIAKGSSGTVSIYGTSSETDVTCNLTCKALGAAITAAKWVTVENINGIWYVGPWECA